MVKTLPNSRSLQQALDSGLIPKTLFDNMEAGSKCGIVTGTLDIANRIRVVPGANLVEISGKFSATDGTAKENVLATVYGVDSVHGSSGLSEGAFNITLADPLPGFIPYFLLFSKKKCEPKKAHAHVRHLDVSSAGSGVAMLYIENPNDVALSQMTATLTWEEQYSDVDLHIIEPKPGSKHVFYRLKNGTTGFLDRDDTDGYGPEHFISAKPDIGNYTFYVNMYARHNITSPAPPVPWKLTFKLGTTIVTSLSGVFDKPGFHNKANDLSHMSGPYILDVSKVTKPKEFNPIPFLLLLEDNKTAPSQPVVQHVPPRAATDWFPVQGTSQGDINWIYEWQRSRDMDATGYSYWEDEFETKLNKGFPSLFFNAQYIFDADFKAVVNECKMKTSNIEKAVCAGKAVRRVFKQDNASWKALFNEKVCRHHTVALAAVLDALGFGSWLFAAWIDDYNAGHLWLGTIIDGKVYFMDSYNDIYVQYGIDPDKFNLLGNATVKVTPFDGMEFQMTPDQNWTSGALWSKHQFSVEKNFFLRFEANFGKKPAGADGVVFVVQSNGPNVIGPFKGHFLAYHNATGLNRSLGVEFDTWYFPKEIEDRNEIIFDHIAVVKNGDILKPVAGPVNATPSGANIDNGVWHSILIRYNVVNTTLSIFFDDENTTRLEYQVSLKDLLGSDAYWGFTSATGDKFNQQLVRLPENLQYGLPGDNEYARYTINWGLVA